MHLRSVPFSGGFRHPQYLPTFWKIWGIASGRRPQQLIEAEARIYRKNAFLHGYPELDLDRPVYWIASVMNNFWLYLDLVPQGLNPVKPPPRPEINRYDVFSFWVRAIFTGGWEKPLSQYSFWGKFKHFIKRKILHQPLSNLPSVLAHRLTVKEFYELVQRAKQQVRFDQQKFEALKTDPRLYEDSEINDQMTWLIYPVYLKLREWGFTSIDLD